MPTSESQERPTLEVFDPSVPRTFQSPVKKINEGQDVTFFLCSKAYADIVTFLLQLNVSMFPMTDHAGLTKVFDIGATSVHFSEPVLKLQAMIAKLDSYVDEAPPETGPRRFGNMAFRTWYNLVEARIDELLRESLASKVLEFKKEDDDESGSIEELRAYLYGSFGSAQRLDYGTGHELSFLAFLACIWKLGGFSLSGGGAEERAIVLGVFEPYLRLIRRLILTYTLEPAGSHGVWGLDDHSFIPYILGSAQLAPAISSAAHIPSEGSRSNAPNPGDVTKATAVERERKTNMYFGAIGFIYDVKRGPFWEHSPVLYDISGVQAGWAKINKGMIKMYIAEVLSKFPVVQHFPFGSMLSWERDPNAIAPVATTHVANQPSKSSSTHDQGNAPSPVSRNGNATVTTAAPWANGATQALSQSTLPSMSAPWATGRLDPRHLSARNSAIPTTREAGAKLGVASPLPTTTSSLVPPPPPQSADQGRKARFPVASTKAPWAQ